MLMRHLLVVLSLFLSFSHAFGETLDEKIGQMLMLGFRGESIEPGSSIEEDIRLRNIGGIVLYDRDVALKSWDRNIKSPEQLKKLTAQAKALATTPLLIAIDQEGGKVNRLKEKYGFAPTKSAAEMGKMSEADLLAEAGQTAQTLVDNGINMNLAPVVDVNVNPQSPAIGKIDRSFSDDSQIVAERAANFIDAHHEHHLLTVLKHFPGHGSATSDSHLDFVDVTKTWTEDELVPYQELIREGKVDAVMTAHVFHKLDGTLPATLSPEIIPQLLRKRLGFDGVVIADDLQMNGIAKLEWNGRPIDLETTIRLAIGADVDILLFANNLSYDPEVGKKAVKIIHQLVKENFIQESRIDRSYARIVKLKEKL